MCQMHLDGSPRCEGSTQYNLPLFCLLNIQVISNFDIRDENSIVSHKIDTFDYFVLEN